MIDAPSLIGADRLQVMAELARATPRGAFVEVGVYRGGSANVLNEVANDQRRLLYLFDTFCGIPYRGPLDWHKVGDFSDGASADQIRMMFPNAVVIEGVFPDSLIQTGPIAFVHADADQYESTRGVCEALESRMVEGGLMLFDDYAFFEGCRTAVRECFPDHETLADGRGLVRF